jgi:rhodanese-related sulfurtransferase
MNVHRVLATTAAMLGISAFFAGEPRSTFSRNSSAQSPAPRAAPDVMHDRGAASGAGEEFDPSRGDRTPLGFSRADVARLASDIVRERDHIAPLDLAEWIRDRKPGLRVLDIRESAEFDAEHVPTAESIALEALVTTSFLPGETIVVYSPEGGHAAQAWVLLRALGYEHVYSLRGGWAAWSREVLHPTVADDATGEERAAFARASALGRYFGGAPREGVRRETPVKARHRGC